MKDPESPFISLNAVSRGMIGVHDKFDRLLDTTGIASRVLTLGPRSYCPGYQHPPNWSRGMRMEYSNSNRSGPLLNPAGVFPAGDFDSLPFLSINTRNLLYPSHEPGWTAAGPMAAFLYKREDLTS